MGAEGTGSQSPGTCPEPAGTEEASSGETTKGGGTQAWEGARRLRQLPVGTVGRASGGCGRAVKPGFGGPGRSAAAAAVTGSRAPASAPVTPAWGEERERQLYPQRGHAGDNDSTDSRGPRDSGFGSRVRKEQD